MCVRTSSNNENKKNNNNMRLVRGHVQQQFSIYTYYWTEKLTHAKLTPPATTTKKKLHMTYIFHSIQENL